MTAKNVGPEKAVPETTGCLLGQLTFLLPSDDPTALKFEACRLSSCGFAMLETLVEAMHRNVPENYSPAMAAMLDGALVLFQLAEQLRDRVDQLHDKGFWGAAQ